MEPLVLDQSDIDFAAEASLTWCTDCADYHFIRPYQQASGRWQLGPWRDEPIFAPMLRQLVPTGGRVLIAASADAGLLDFALRALAEQSPSVTVADLCEAPLAVCRRYAGLRGTTIETVRADLTEAVPKGPFDAVIAHIVLRFIPPPLRVKFLSRLADSLSPRGGIVLTHLTGGASSAHRTNMGARIAEGLAERGLVVRDPARLAAAIEREESTGRDPTREAADVDALVAEAGLLISEDVRLPPGPPGRTREWRYMLLRPEH